VSEVPEIDVTEAARRVDGEAVLLDVRELDEWDAGRVDGALHIPLGQLAARQDEVPTDRVVVVVCRSGVRSATAAAALLAADYDAVNLAGGMKAWAGAGLPVVTDGGAPGTVA
jgi:rhodanese-related sulfurtransferase